MNPAEIELMSMTQGVYLLRFMNFKYYIIPSRPFDIYSLYKNASV